MSRMDGQATSRDQRATVLDTASQPAPARDTAPVGAAERGTLEAQYAALLAARAIPRPVPYHFVRELGRGRQGVVFLALREGARGCLTRHAVKLFDPGVYSSADKYWNDMGRLARQLSKLQPVISNNLVTPDTYEECEGIGHMQMAAIDGIDLQTLIEGTHVGIARSQSSDEEWARFMSVLFRVGDGRFQFQPGLALYVLREVLQGLAVLHGAGFLHGDIKPSNIMIDRMGVVRLVDFGRAVAVGETIDILLGSPMYMAPEVHALAAAEVQSDLFSAGLVALEMLRGDLAGDLGRLAEAELVAFKQRMSDDVHVLLPGHIRENRLLLVNFLRRFVQPQPAQRYASAAKAEEALYRLRELQWEMGLLAREADYEWELKRYLAKITDPLTGHLNPKLEPES
jgi:serine/threonine protein kinase